MREKATRRLSRRSVLKATGAAGLASIAGCSGGNQPEDWVMGTSQQGSSTFSIGQALQSVLREHSDRVNLTAQSSSGQVANARQLGGEYDLAIMSNNIHYDAIKETGPFADNPPKNPILAGFSVTGAECFMLTTAGNDIETYNDLTGKTIATYGTGSALYQLTMTVFEELGIRGDYDHREIPLNEIASAMDNGRIKACGGYTTLRGTSVSGAMQELISRVDLKPVTFSDEEREAVSDITSPPIEKIQPEPFKGIDEVTAWTDTANVVFGDHLSEDLVNHVMETWLSNWDQVKETYGGVVDATNDALTSGFLPNFSLHPGAATYFEDQGVDISQWDVGTE